LAGAVLERSAPSSSWSTPGASPAGVRHLRGARTRATRVFDRTDSAVTR
jgi:hypothetical protein